MKLPLLLLSLCAASAAPLESPRAASVQKSAPMVRSGGVPLTEPAPVMWITFRGGINFFGCNTNDPACQLYFVQKVSVVQLAGTELTIEFADTANATQWAFAARFGAGPFDRVSEFTWFQPEWQRPPARFFKSRSVIPILPASRGAEPVNVVSPALTLATATSRKR